MDVLSCVGAATGVKPFEPFGKDSVAAQKAETRDDGPTGPATSSSPEGEFAETVRSASGRKPRMGRFIRILRAKASDDVWNVAASGADLTVLQVQYAQARLPKMDASDH
jgi:hypothetical protein